MLKFVGFISSIIFASMVVLFSREVDFSSKELSPLRQSIITFLAIFSSFIIGIIAFSLSPDRLIGEDNWRVIHYKKEYMREKPNNKKSSLD